jgi:selenium-binding protein 1
VNHPRAILALATLFCAASVVASEPAHHDEESPQERFLYVATLAKSASDPDFVAVVGADPCQRDFGRIVSRIDMPNVGDELHHFGYSADQKRLIVPGLFSNRIHILAIQGKGRRMRLQAVDERLAEQSGYIIPHSVIATTPGTALVTMIGAATGDTTPGGVVEIDDATGAFKRHFGPGPSRGPGDPGPKYMYDFDSMPAINRGISTTFGPPALCGPGIDPSCLGDEIAVWDLHEQKVIQTANLGTNSGALEVRFIEEPDVRRAFIDTPGTHAVWLAHDDDANGVFEFSRVLGAEECAPQARRRLPGTRARARFP